MQIKAGVRGQPVSSSLVGSSCAIYLADEGSSADLRTWRLKVYADTNLVGQITTRTAPAPAGGHPPAPRGRMVAMASCPGAKDWVVTAEWAEPTIPDPVPVADLYILEGDDKLAPGLVPVNERSRYVAGAAAGVVSLAVGQRVTQWAAFSTVGAASVDINGQGAIPIPVGGAVRGEPAGALDGAVFTFVGFIGGYLIEWKET